MAALHPFELGPARPRGASLRLEPNLSLPEPAVSLPQMSGYRTTSKQGGEMHMTSKRKLLALAVAAPLAALAGWGPASAQTVLKWAHVYEISEPYHKEAVWAAEEIKKRTNGNYDIQVFPASQLGNENQINEALGLGTVDLIYTGVAFAGSIHKPLSITQRALHPARLRSLEGLSRQQAVPRHRQGLRGQDQAQGDRAQLLRPAAFDRQPRDHQARGHEGHEAARAAGAAVPDVHQVGRRQRHARSPSPRSIWRCRTRPSTARRTRCRPSSPRNSTKCRATSC